MPAPTPATRALLGAPSSGVPAPGALADEGGRPLLDESGRPITEN